MHKMRAIATDDPVAWCICQLVGQPVTRLFPKMAERIEVLFGIKTSRLEHNDCNAHTGKGRRVGEFCSPCCEWGRGFDAAIVTLLWPFV